MSDSELSDVPTTPLPPDSELEKSLRREVVKAQRAGLDDPTVNSIRAASEEKLGLKAGFYKNHETWLARSKQIIKEQFAIQDETESSPPPPSKSTTNASSDIPKKRASEEREPWPRKRKKVVNEPERAVSSDDLSSPPSDSEFETPEEKPKKKQQQQRKTAKSATKQKPRAAASKKKKPSESESNSGSDQAKDDDSESAEENPKKKQQRGKASKPTKAKVDDSDAELEKNNETKEDAHTSSKSNDAKKNTLQQDEASDSELSELLDEAPPPKKRQKQKDSTGTKSTKGKPAKGKAEADIDPEQAEIKRLQGWLVKCGIRKVWGKELKPFGTPKAKIKHLKEMLADAGMTGRYSVEKANQIKEARELAADIEAVQKGAERWGADDEDADGKVKESVRPARRLVRGAKNYDFLSSDGEETD